MSMSAMPSVKLVRAIVRTFGWRGLTRRFRHEVRIRTRGYRIAPDASDGDRDWTPSPPLLQPRSDFAAMPAAWRDEAVRRGECVIAGAFEAYGCQWRALPDDAEAWKRDPTTGHRFADAPWWKIETLPPEADIKDVWEPARFTWAYDLVRAFAVTQRQEFADGFYARLEAWIASSPPFRGVHWACGQETAIRALAVMHAIDTLPSGTGSARGSADTARTLLAWSGERIADGLDYGASQRNNHGISEAAALVHLGLRFQERHPRAEAWLRQGTRVLHEQILDQFAMDGWYAQHSFTYLRLALEQALLVQRALRSYGRSLSDTVLDRLARGAVLLTEVIDSDSGEAPNHGSNDGALLTRYSLAAYRDMRPALTLAAVELGLKMPADVEPDAATMAWLGVDCVGRAAAREDGVASGPSGWASARVGAIHVFLRAGVYRHRPSHLDALHLDVRWAGREVVVDPGTFAYNRPPIWRNPLSAAFVHNGPLVTGHELGERGPRFLWYAWPAARLHVAEYEEGRLVLEAAVPGGARRQVTVREDGVTVVDGFSGPTATELEVNWTLAPGMAEDVLVIDRPIRAYAADENDVRAWFSPSYGVRIATLMIVARATGTDPRIETQIRTPAAERLGQGGSPRA